MSNKEYYESNKEELLKKSKKYYVKNREKIKTRTKLYRDSHKKEIAEYQKTYSCIYSLESRMLVAAKQRAGKKGLDFNIDVEDIIIPEKCPYLGITIFKTGGKAKNNSPSLDRIDPTKGYIKGNVEVISWRANSLKKDASSNELITIGNKLKERGY